MHQKIGRNDICYCGSGKKYKQCCMSGGGVQETKTPGISEEIAYALRVAQSHLSADRLNDAAIICQNILTRVPNSAEALNLLGIVNFYSGNHQAAITLLVKSVRIKPGYADAHNNLGEFYRVSGNIQSAVKHLQAALKINPNNINAMINYGNALQDIYKYDEAIVIYKKVLRLEPGHLGTLSNLANLYQQLMMYGDAANLFSQIIVQDENYEWALGGLVYSKLNCCDWAGYPSQVLKINEKIKAGFNVIKPFELLAISSSAESNYACATSFARSQYPVVSNPIPYGTNADFDRKIKVGYFSADFHDHATMHLMAELFALHDTNKFELFAFSFGPDSNDKWRKRILTNFKEFIDVRFKSDSDVALIARDIGIDIAVDLKGYTTHSRAGIFSKRAAPVQVSFLGYPGTMGADFIDYIIADNMLVSNGDEQFFSEKIVYLPNTYQVNDMAQNNEGQNSVTRADCGLPEVGFVFCCFNNNYKITPNVFETWMRILKKVKGSVLWLIESNPIAKENLYKEAMLEGVDCSRLIFAKHVSREDHIARLGLGDLFLDTLPYNAHTTASDALRVGLPILTVLGDYFPGRVAASLLHAIGLPELIMDSFESYESSAVAFGKDMQALQDIKRKLKTNIPIYPLFNTGSFVEDLEGAYNKMYQTYCKQSPVESISFK